MEGETKAPSFVVGLGASAGGLEALERFFDTAPIDSGGAFVVVMHLARDFRSVLDELLARHTRMPVYPIKDGDALAADTVYVIQPGAEVEVLGTTFKVSNRPAATSTGRVSSIDILFQSIAASWREKGAAVILSGSGSDGAHGVVAVHAAGGLVLAQSPESSKFDSMPIAAIATNSVSGVDTPELLALLIQESIHLPRLGGAARKSTADDVALQRILASVVGSSHLDASQYTQSTFERRVQRRMREVHATSLTSYSELIERDRGEARTLSETLLIGVTDFFRDESAFSSLARQVAPDLIRRAAAEQRPIRIWAPGCASGEEAYSLAMTFAEASADFPTPVDVQIFATDVHKDLLAEAARGEYSTERMQSVSESRRRAFFKRTASGAWQVDSKIRKTIVFAPHDVLIDPPFTRLDLVSCRNLLIYFSVEAQQRVIGSFAFGLMEKGYLFLGGSETVGAQRESFEFVDVRRRIFRRTRAASRSPTFTGALEPYERLGISPTAASRRSLKSREAMLQPAYSALLKAYAPPCFLISSERELLHTFGEARKFLRAPEGVARLDITDMCDPALKTPLMAGIDRVARDKEAITFSRVELQAFPQKGLVVDVVIEPLAVEIDATFALVIINEINPPLGPDTHIIADSPIDPDASARIAELQVEVMRTREALQATIEEIEASNEELQATNEELMSSNEELQSTNEELSSLNEELHSVNAEHFRQNDELVRLTRDFDALLHATEIGVLFFDEDLNIRRFTRLVAELFQFADTDIGRPLRTFRSPFPNFDIEGFLSRIMRGGLVEEAEVYDSRTRAWLLRAAGYPDQSGVVLSIISITRLKDGQAAAIAPRDRILDSASPFGGDPVVIVTPGDGCIRFTNTSAAAKLGLPEEPQTGLRVSRITPEWGDPAWTAWLSAISVGGQGKQLDMTIIDRYGALFSADMVATMIMDEDEIYAVVRFIENRDRARELRDLKERARMFAISNRELEQFASVVAHDLRAPLRHLSQFSEYLMSELGSSMSEQVDEYLHIITSSAANLSSMVERLLDYARIGAGAPAFETIELNDCLDRARSLLVGEIQAADCTFDAPLMPAIKGDKLLMARLFQNLIVNSLKYGRTGIPVRIHITTKTNHDWVYIYFQDNGIGIKSSNAANIFNMFSRLHSDAEYTGHGMGLAICKRVCEIHGGSISLDTEAGDDEGARFVVRLPKIKAQ